MIARPRNELKARRRKQRFFRIIDIRMSRGDGYKPVVEAKNSNPRMATLVALARSDHTET